MLGHFTSCLGNLCCGCMKLLRVRVRWFIPLTNRFGFGSCYFRQWPLRRQPKIDLFLFLIPLEGTFTSFFELKIHSEVSKWSEFMFFLFLLYDRSRNRIHIRPLASGSGWPKNVWILRIRFECFQECSGSEFRSTGSTCFLAEGS